MRVGENITELIGDTPLVKMNQMTDATMADIYLKLEFYNPGGSVKDRIGLAMIEDAEQKGAISPERSTIIEPTSGNTGIALAMVCAGKGYRALLVMPDTMSIERRNLLRAFGAELVLTPGSKGMKGAVAKAQELEQENEGYYMLQQFDNPANVKVHRETTGKELLEQGKQIGGIDAFVVGIGTGGTITGAGEVLKEAYPDMRITAIEPADSPILSGGKPGPHKIQGLGAGFIPSILDTDIYDDVLTVTTDEAIDTARRAAKEEGVLGGISSGAAVHSAIQVAKELGPGKNVVTVIPSNGERYLSTPLYEYQEES